MISSTLMVQGTTSDAGKSTFVAALCRILKRRTISVVPFKPQNMSLNSAVTDDGGEIGRAQALQAYAAGVTPHTDMNPILIKPNSVCSSQIIIQGQAVTTVSAQAHQDYRQRARAAVMASYERLRRRYDVVLAEGAGSSAEVNLRHHDIANMGFAEAVDCPVIIVADIDRGGVFAHLVGTLQLLNESERRRVVGFVINRFRGDIKHLQSGLDWLTQETNRPVLAVLPYIQDLQLDAEDALPHEQSTQQYNGLFKVVVPTLPRISNHTDFDILRYHPQVDFEFVPAHAPIPNADLIILPGTKNVREDLAWLHEQGWVTEIFRHLRYGGKVIGICGGFQMLGREILDPGAVESVAGGSEGLGLLDMITVLKDEKVLRNVEGTLFMDGVHVKGYEIHAGCSSGVALERPAMDIQGRVEGAVSKDNQVLGTYIHGLFDTQEACSSLLKWAGLKAVKAVDLEDIREANINRLADVVEENLDMSFVPKSTYAESVKRMLSS